MLVALLFVVVGIKAVALGDPRRWSEPISIGQADAAVAVLLIVPGVLLARLDIFSTHSVLGQLRRFPVAVAYFSVVVTTTLALFVAAQRADYSGKVLSTVFSVGAVVLLSLLALCGIESAARWIRRHVPVPRSATVPVWLRERNLGNGFLRADSASRAPDVFFDAIRPVSNTIGVASREYEQKRARWEREETGAGSALTEGPALLAELTARAVSKDYKAAWIEIRHGRAGLPGTLDENLDDLLYVSFGGNYCQILSGYVKEYEASAFTPLSPRTTEQSPDADAAWSESAEIPPVVIRANVHDVDLLIGFAHIAKPDRQARRMLTFLDQALTCAAGFDSVVPTLVLAPATTPANVHERPKDPQLAVGRTLRLTLTMPQSEHEARLELESKLARLAHDLDVDLWRASRTPGAGQGDWQRIVSAQPRAADAAAPRVHGPATLVPVTFVGGRGADSVGSFRKLTKALLDADVQVSSLTASVVGQHAIVHVALAGPSVTAARHFNGVLTTEEAFAELARRRVIATPIEQIAALVDIKFTACIGLNQPGRRWLPPWRALQPAPAARPVFERDPLEPRRSLWVDWQLPSEPSTKERLAQLLLEYCAPIGPTEILYWRVHRTPDDEIRGRAKLAVRIDRTRLDDLVARRGSLGDQAKHVQSEVTRRLVSEVVGLPANAVYLHVVWSEPWLVRRRGV